MDQARLGPASTFTRPRNRLTDCQSSVKELATRSSPNFPWIFLLPSFLLSLLSCLVLPDSTLFSLFFPLPLFFHPNASVAVFQRESSLSLSLVRFRLDSIDQFLENCFHLDLKAGTIIGKIFTTRQLGRNDVVAFSERGERGSVAECDRAACAIIDVCQSGSN